MKNELYFLKAHNTGEELTAKVRELCWVLAGPDARFQRQKALRELTGENILVNQAGVNRLFEKAMEYVNAEPEKVVFQDETDEATAEKVEVGIVAGIAVVRKACKREGVIQSVDGDKVIVLLADGSVRKPNADRFRKLYQF
jgi:hypothetical protein